MMNDELSTGSYSSFRLHHFLSSTVQERGAFGGVIERVVVGGDDEGNRAGEFDVRLKPAVGLARFDQRLLGQPIVVCVAAQLLLDPSGWFVRYGGVVDCVLHVGFEELAAIKDGHELITD